MDAHKRQTTGRSQSHSSSQCQRAEDRDQRTEDRTSALQPRPYSEDRGRRTEDRTSALQPRPISCLHADPRAPAPAPAVAIFRPLSSVFRPPARSWWSRARSSSSAPGGADRDRTGDLLLAKQALSQLSYGPDSEPRSLATFAVRRLACQPKRR